MPELLRLADEAAYKEYFITNYVRSAITTRDGIRVYFKADDFGHAFYECSQRDKNKDTFSPMRSQRMSWIRETLQAEGADWYQGYIAKGSSYDPARSVVVAYEDFVVVLRFRMGRDGALKASFVTCYYADNSIGKIRKSPIWSLDTCRSQLQK